MILNYPLTRSVLAREVYKVRPQTFSAWLKEIGIFHKRTLSPRELRLIIRSYELPDGIQIKLPASAPILVHDVEDDIPKLTRLLGEFVKWLEKKNDEEVLKPRHRISASLNVMAP